MYKLPKEIEDLISLLESTRDIDWKYAVEDSESREYLITGLRETYKVWYPE